MAELATIARPYAEALFRVAKADNTGGNLAAWSELMSELAVVATNSDMTAAADNPKIAGAELLAIFKSALKSQLSIEADNFLSLLVENGRLTLLPEIAAQFHALKNAYDSSADVEITSAFPIEGAQLNDLVATLERKFGKTLHPTVKVDASLIGGVRVQVGDEVLDTSVRAKLAKMQVALTA